MESTLLELPQVVKINEFSESWSEKYKRSIDCKNPKGFSQRAHCAGRKKNESLTEDIPPMEDLVAMATVASISVPVLKAMIKAAYKTGKGLLQLKRIANRAGVKLADRMVGEAGPGDIATQPGPPAPAAGTKPYKLPPQIEAWPGWIKHKGTIIGVSTDLNIDSSELQKWLIDVGGYDLEIDGKFGTNTSAALDSMMDRIGRGEFDTTDTPGYTIKPNGDVVWPDGTVSPGVKSKPTTKPNTTTSGGVAYELDKFGNLVRVDEQDEESPIDLDKIRDVIVKLERAGYITPESANAMRRAIQGLASKRQTVYPMEILQLLTALSS